MTSTLRVTSTTAPSDITMARQPSMADVSERRFRRSPNHESVITPTTPTRPISQVRPIARTVLGYGEALLAVAVAGVLSWTMRDDLVATRLLLFWVASTYAA